MRNPFFPYEPFDRQPGRIGGIGVIQSPDVPRYTLPDEVIPGVPWPPGFRDDDYQQMLRMAAHLIRKGRPNG